MTPAAIILLVISAAVHAGWNLLGKRQQPSPAFMLAANTLGFLYLTPALLLFWRVQAHFPPLVWLLLAATGLCQAVYYAGLAAAYRLGDLSIVYPLLRSMPVVLVAVLTSVLGLGKPLNLQAGIGILLVVTGGFILPMRRFSDFRLQNYLNRSIAITLVAALGTVGYSIIDSEALRLARQAVGQTMPAYAVTLVYAFWEGAASSLWLAILAWAQPGKRQEMSRLQNGGARGAALVGIGIYAAYVLVLAAMGYVNNVSYVVAFRQLSIPLGALLGVVALGEPHPATKLTGIAILFAGLVLVGTA